MSSASMRQSVRHQPAGTQAPIALDVPREARVGELVQALSATAALNASRAELCLLASAVSNGPDQRRPNWFLAFLLLSQIDRALRKIKSRYSTRGLRR